MSSVDWANLHKQGEDATKPVPIGDYTVQVTESELKQASTGSQMIVVKMRITNGPATGRMLFSNIVFSTEKAFALAMWFKTLGAFGIDVNFLNTLQGDINQQLSQIATLLKGRVCTVEAGIKNWQGSDRNEVKAWKPAPLGTMQPQLVAGIGAVPGIGAPGLSPSSPMNVTPGSSAAGGPPIPGVAAVGTPAHGVVPGTISVVPTVTQEGAGQTAPSTPPPADAF